ncbi:MAG: hypothetical protein SVX38_08795 [Chloroflexota bacterium]|nr:hypothetical protein [Chloroflexota bacterium]
MWLIAEYQPVGLFSLKSTLATSSGGKSLLVPTPYAIKMALLDAACRLWGVGAAEAIWPTLRDLSVALRLPERVVVTNLFTKILKPSRSASRPGTQHAGPLGKTIAFREYVWAGGNLGIALGLEDGERVTGLTDLLLQINYLGKRGGFVQLDGPPTQANELPGGYMLVNGPPTDRFYVGGLMQVLDDCDVSLTFEKANIYSGKNIKLGKERILHHVVLPYRLVRSSKSFSYYERIGEW